MAKPFLVLVATDGSAGGRTAVSAAVRFPWPARSAAQGIVARRVPVVADWPAPVWDALARAEDAEARRAARQLRARWPEARAVVVNAAPVEAILREARRRRAGAVVVGSRGLGAIGRLMLGSVSRAVVRRATGAVLVTRGRPRAVQRLVVGVDGSAHARRAVDLVASLQAPRGGEVRLLAVIEPVRLPSSALLPASVRAAIEGEAAAMGRERAAQAQRRLAAARAQLARSGWRVDTEVRTGSPLDEILAVAARADALVVGARGTGAIERLLLGSVAEGALTRSPIPVLVAR